MAEEQNNESVFPIKFLTESKLQYLLNYIAKDLGLVDSGKNKTFINGEWVHKDLNFETNGYRIKTNGQFPFYAYQAFNDNNKQYYGEQYSSPTSFNVIVYQNKIHLFGSGTSSNDAPWGTVHIAGEPGKWEVIGECPDNYISDYTTVIYNNKLHFIRRGKHYTWDGKKWEQLPQCPYNPNYVDSAVVFNNKIYLYFYTYQYSYDGTTWTQETNSPFYRAYSDGIIVYNNKIHYACGSSNKHYTWDGTTWTQEVDLPNQYRYNMPLFIYNNKLYWFPAGSGNNVTTGEVYYLNNNNEWVLSDIFSRVPLQYNVNTSAANGYKMIFFKNKMYLFGRNYISNAVNCESHYRYYDFTNHEWKSSFDDDINIQIQKYKRV